MRCAIEWHLGASADVALHFADPLGSSESSENNAKGHGEFERQSSNHFHSRPLSRLARTCQILCAAVQRIHGAVLEALRMVERRVVVNDTVRQQLLRLGEQASSWILPVVLDQITSVVDRIVTKHLMPVSLRSSIEPNGARGSAAGGGVILQQLRDASYLLETGIPSLQQQLDALGSSNESKRSDQGNATTPEKGIGGRRGGINTINTMSRALGKCSLEGCCTLEQCTVQVQSARKRLLLRFADLSAADVLPAGLSLVESLTVLEGRGEDDAVEASLEPNVSRKQQSRTSTSGVDEESLTVRLILNVCISNTVANAEVLARVWRLSSVIRAVIALSLCSVFSAPSHSHTLSIYLSISPAISPHLLS